MKTSLHLDSLHLKVRGVSAATAAAALRDLGPALAHELGAGAKPGAPIDAGKPLSVSRGVSSTVLRSTVAAHVAGALRSHLGSNPR